ncbi:hypothetical protein F7734_55300 [Scytonema sp. UIC 10036]|uniref:hypothetical protein n=1 Tax=Scytonema sp. UIC 10036 TaxID=2304196 RepID=UPI0012DAA4AD|nr:hypothetical protein [Scytonema sp. UIC 10036]MUH00951.1 hypothetical protein [Scytonema sp. UIC 10036]
MQSTDERVESIAEMIVRLVCEYEARQAAIEAKKVQISTTSRLSPHSQLRK